MAYTAFGEQQVAELTPMAGTTLTGGTVVFSVTLDKVDSQVFDLDRWGIFLAPGEKITISAQSASATEITVALNWVDLI